jgi:hypothetical protein
MNKATKMAAICSAVLQYIKSEEEALIMQAQAASQAAATTAAVRPANAWGVSGRQAHMNLRTLMQFKAFNRMR